MARYEIAGLQVDMEASGRTQRQAAAYAAPASGQPDVVLRCDIQWLLRHNPRLSDPELAEYLGLGTLFARELLRHQGFQLHASAVILGGKAYLFSAPCGMGKSTHTEKWVRLLGARFLNDDKPALRRIDGVWTAFGTPWSGKHDLSSPVGVPLGGIAFLQRGDENRIVPISPKQALPWLMSQTVSALPKQKLELLLPLVDDLLRSVPLWQLHCLNNDEAARVSYAAMTQTTDF